MNNRLWPRVRLEEVCILNPRRPALNRASDTPTSFVPMIAVDGIRGEICRLETKCFEQVRVGYTYFAEGDVLFAKITPCMQNGKHAIARGLLDGIGFGSTEFHVLRPTECIISEWIHFYLRQPGVLKRAQSTFTGAVGQQRVPESFLANEPIPLPSVETQRHITVRLKEQLAHIEQAREAAKKEVAAINRLPAALLREAFSGKI